MPNLTVSVVGAGITGAMIAYKLACQGYTVTLFEAAGSVGGDVSRMSFGWISHICRDPAEDPETFALLVDGMERYRTLNTELNGSLFGPQTGSIVWRKTPEQTDALIKCHKHAGTQTRPIGLSELQTYLPALANPPEVAAHTPNDFAWYPPRVIAQLVHAFKALGGEVVLNKRISALKAAQSRCKGIIVDDRVHASDFTVLAAGGTNGVLIERFEPQHELYTSPSTYIELSADLPEFSSVLQTPSVELRSLGSGRFAMAEYPPTSDDPAELKRIGEITAQAVRDTFLKAGPVEVLSIQVGQRPAHTSSSPLARPIEGMDNAFVAGSHPGVILAPLIAERICQQISERLPVSAVF
ncbi:FAD-dependent oxidoreductase [Pseudovibrio sp. Tun.PSC04-5.I4]|uniref:NAD(P)/FAD-dependent oxidoreductase n=1 Tax=Pseudovibrio sp. Tun.PSC04-5.I4 TaxID=1798213 RepID=UPI000880FBC6|nr:FAD-dependent oxidoreductase [Pseudovibrio sp. Tun.PSC04-5.I4]SDQ19592.1 Glycine/D-amino acid oxidase [Pseudovibrio sp. Tun.PSC04-5.I4]